MKYRVTLDLAFDTQADASKVFNAAKMLFAKAKALNEMEQSTIVIHKCYHDEGTSKPCEVLQSLGV